MSEQRKQMLADNHPYLAGLIDACLFFGLLTIIGGVIGVPFIAAGMGESIASIGTAIAGLIVLWLYKWHYRPEFRGSLTGGRPGLGIKLSAVFLISWALIPFSLRQPGSEFGMPTASNIAIALAAGIGEEAAFRSAPISTMMRGDREGKRILPAVILSAVLFGLVHATNVFSGADPGSTLFQVLGATFVGVALGAIFIRTGNIIPCMAVHVLNDILAFLDIGAIEDGVVTGGVNAFTYFDTAACFVIGIIGLWFVRPAKRAEIARLWADKWSIEESN